MAYWEKLNVFQLELLIDLVLYEQKDFTQVKGREADTYYFFIFFFFVL